MELDTNAVERAMRPIALCCKLHAVNPQAYLEDVLTGLVAGYAESQIDPLTPWAWQTSTAACSTHP